MRRVTSILVGEHQGFIHIEVSANAFLYHMVRNIVGALRLVGARKRPPEWMGDLLLAKDRHQAGRMAPAHGLYLEHVGYDLAINYRRQRVIPRLDSYSTGPRDKIATVVEAG